MASFDDLRCNAPNWHFSKEKAFVIGLIFHLWAHQKHDSDAIHCYHRVYDISNAINIANTMNSSISSWCPDGIYDIDKFFEVEFRNSNDSSPCVNPGKAAERRAFTIAEFDDARSDYHTNPQNSKEKAVHKAPSYSSFPLNLLLPCLSFLVFDELKPRCACVVGTLSFFSGVQRASPLTET